MISRTQLIRLAGAGTLIATLGTGAAMAQTTVSFDTTGSHSNNQVSGNSSNTWTQMTHNMLGVSNSQRSGRQFR